MVNTTFASEFLMKQILSIPQQMGPILQAARKSAGLSQTVLARRLGISQSRLSAMELEPGSISLDQLLKLLSALNFELLVQTKMSSKVDLSASEW
jgi:HTH-type transcriptional regulator/antitoxin HipB